MFGKPIDEEFDNVPSPQEHVDFLNFLRNYLYQHYEPVAAPEPGIKTMTTRAVYEALQLVLPSDILTMEMVAVWLFDGGYKLTDMGELRLEWMMKVG